MSPSAAGDRPQVRVVVLDVNETLSDLTPMRQRFADVGAEESLASTWFAAVLRDGMALSTVGEQAAFADIGRSLLDAMLPARLSGAAYADDRAAAVEHVLAGFSALPVHPDVPGGLRALAERGIRVVTLSNGAASVAQGLLERAGVSDLVEATLSVADAGIWKPAARAYEHALAHTGEPAGAHLLVAVHPWDVHGARRAGLGGAWVDRSGSAPYPAHFAAPDLRARGLDDLADQLAAPGGASRGGA